jgi:hypothetical protein
MKLTPVTIQKTREWFADNARACIKAASEGEWHVNDLPRYIAQHNQRIEESLSGAYDHTFAFVQRALYIQTEVSAPLL